MGATGGACNHLIEPLTVTLTETDLNHRFAEDRYFSPIIHFLSSTPTFTMTKEHHCLEHMARGFYIDKGKLWCLNPRGSDQTTRLECVLASEGLALALHHHQANGHFG